MPRQHVFISYPSKEITFTHKLKADLENEGVRTWLDKSQEGIQIGDDWVDTLSDAIDDSFAMIAVFCPHYVESQWCLNELRRALANKIPVFPVRIRPVPARDVPFEMGSLQHIGFEKWQEPREYEKQLARLVQQLRQQFPEQIGMPLPAEQRYLNSLITELESSQTVNVYLAQTLERQASATMRERPRHYPERPYLVETWIASSEEDDETGASAQRPTIELPTAEDLLAYDQRFVILGDAGTGKSTVLRRIALTAARQRQADPDRGLLPVMLELSEWTDSYPTVESFLRTALPEGTSIDREDLLWCLDGLSELGEDAPRRALELRRWLAATTTPHNLILTCRRDYYTDALDVGIENVIQLTPLSDAQVEAFARHYLGANAGTFLGQIYGDQVRDNTRPLLLELVRNPLMLSMLTYVFESNPNQNLPQNTSRVFSQMVETLLLREDARGSLGKHKPADVRSALAKLAFAMIDGGRPREVPLDYAMSRMHLISGRSLLEAALEANLLETRGVTVRFAHPAMQEYFAALEVDRRSIVDKIRPAALDQAGRRLNNKWDNTIVALAGISDSPSTFTEQIAQRDLFLALRCAYSGADVLPDLQDRLLRQLLTPSADGKTLNATLKIEFDKKTKKKKRLELYWRAAEDTLNQTGAAIVPQLLRWLYRLNEPKLRSIIIRVLGHAQSATAAPHLVNMLDKGNLTQQEVVLTFNALRSIASAEMTLDMCRYLETKYVVNAALVLHAISDERAVPALAAAALRPYEIEVRLLLVRILATFADARSIPALTAIMKDRKSSARKLTETVSAVLPQIGEVVVAGALTVGTGAWTIASLRSNSGSLNTSHLLTKAMSNFGEKFDKLGKAVDALPDLRAAALEGLMAIPDREAITGLVVALSDSDAAIRARAAGALEMRRWSRNNATDEELAYYHGSRGEWSSMLTLGEAGEAVFLQLMAEQPDKIRTHLEEIYRQKKQGKAGEEAPVAEEADAPATETEPPAEPAALTTTPPTAARDREALAIDTTGGKLTVSVDMDEVRTQLNDLSGKARDRLKGFGVNVGSNDAEKARIAEMLSDMSAEAAREQLVQLLNAPTSATRAAAADALAQHADDEVQKALIERLADADADVRKAAARSLGAQKAAHAVVPLVLLLQDKAGAPRLSFGKKTGERVCDVAADALRAIGSQEALDALAMWQRSGG